MSSKTTFLLSLLLLLVAPALWSADADSPKWTFELEAGPVWQSRNDVQIPNNESATRFSLVDLAGNGPWFAPRIQISWTIKQRHGLQLFLASLSYTETGQFEEPVRFAGETFSPDTGFVPLFLFEADYRFADRWHLLAELDALAGGPGRAEDLALKIGYDLSDRWRLTAGYRMIEGGVDVEEVYNFAWFHSAVASAVYRL